MSEHPNAFIGTYFYFSYEDSLNFINILVKAYLVLRLCTYICNVLGYADNLLSWCNNSFQKLNTKRFCPFSWHQKISHFISAFIISWIVQRQIPFGTVFWTSNLIIYLIRFYFSDLRVISMKYLYYSLTHYFSDFDEFHICSIILYWFSPKKKTSYKIKFYIHWTKKKMSGLLISR